MKVVKVQPRWKLADYGMTVALRFDYHTREAERIRRWLATNRGPEPWTTNNWGQWRTHWGKPNSHSKRPYFIGLRDPEDVSLILLLKDTLTD